MIRMLCVTPYPHHSADTRYRIEQFVPGLEQAGIHIVIRPFMSERLFAIYPKSGKQLMKFYEITTAMARRLLDLIRARKYDVVFLHKEAFALGPPWLERALRTRTGALIYDMDDAFWSHPPQIRQIGKILRDPTKIDKVIKMSDHVLAGNTLIADYVRSHNSSVTILPTVIDTGRYQPVEQRDSAPITIGWVGRWSSSFYLDSLVEVFHKLCERHPCVQIKLIGASEVNWSGVRVVSQPWRLETEIEDLQSFTIGIMPLVDDEYARYKCGFKLLQYMGIGIPSVASPVGVNAEIIQDGVNGFLTSTPLEWFERLNQLIESPSLRANIGAQGRLTVETHYSLEKALPIFTQTVRNVVNA